MALNPVFQDQISLALYHLLIRQQPSVSLLAFADPIDILLGYSPMTE
jgi:hypothetical protein